MRQRASASPLAGRWLMLTIALATAAALVPVRAVAAPAIAVPASGPGAPHSDNGPAVRTAGFSISLLQGVAYAAPGHAWAVGYYWTGTADRTLIEQLDGTAWTVVRSPNGSSSSNFLNGVAAVSPSNAWAVGYFDNGTENQTLIEHWDGATWKRVKSPTISGKSSYLYSVAASSPSSAWAVGHYLTGNAEQTLTEHWNGTSWKIVKSPVISATKSSALNGVTILSPSSAWAVGTTQESQTRDHTLAEHWNGTAWSRVPSPNLGGSSGLYSVAAYSSDRLWAVGIGTSGGSEVSLIERWNGTTWKQIQVQGAATATSASLDGVIATSAANAWAVGRFNTTSGEQTLIEHWNGRAWTVTPSPDQGGLAAGNSLAGVASIAGAGAWAIGEYNLPSSDLSLIEHWNGKAWKLVASPNKLS